MKKLKRYKQKETVIAEDRKRGRTKMRYHNITKDDMLNGDGLRVVLWTAGCLHHCKECQNPLTWDPKGGLLFQEETKQELFEELKKSYISGITFSGGDPLHPDNRKEVEALSKEIKEKFPRKTVWLYTGSLWEEIQEESILSYLDVVVEGPFIADLKDTQLHWKGSSNQRVIDVPKTLERGVVVLYDE